MNGLRGGSVAWVRRVVAAVAVVAAAGTSGICHAGEPLSITRLYGAGVHAYFSGDYLRSYDDLTATIEAGSQDPRPHYFRGLAALGLGRLDEAEADFSEGALREAEASGNWPVSQSLERVQGYARFQLECHRARARVAALQRANERKAVRYRETEAAQPDVQRLRRPTGQPSGADETANAFDPDKEHAASSPAAEQPKASEPKPVDAPATPAAKEASASGGTAPNAEMDQPANESTGVREESPVELPEDDGVAPREKPAAAGGAAEPAMPAAGDETPLGDETLPPGATNEPVAEEGNAPAEGGG